jgi:hypothetical protein
MCICTGRVRGDPEAMAIDPPDRRYRSDRRQHERADDLHRRLEEKRQQLERRQVIRRQSDREAAEDRQRRETTDEGSTPATSSETQPTTE